MSSVEDGIRARFSSRTSDNGQPTPDKNVHRADNGDRNLAVSRHNGYGPATPSPTIPQPDRPTTGRPSTIATPAAHETIAGNEYGFLRRKHIGDLELTQAYLKAWTAGTTPHEELINDGRISPADYAFSLARSLKLEYWDEPASHLFSVRATPIMQSVSGHLLALRYAHAGRGILLIDATGQLPGSLPRFIQENARAVDKIIVVTRRTLLAAFEQSKRSRFLTFAIDGLRRTRPALSAGCSVWLWQSVCIASVVGLAAGALAMAPRPSLVVLTGLMIMPFFCVVVLRCMALREVSLGGGRQGGASSPQTTNAELPVYTVLVPLFRETAVLPQLLAALAALDYPAMKVQILLVLEASDAETIAAVAATRLAANIDVIIVPDAQPRTKPKAVNYALQFARGKYTVIFDAEDVPDPDQLRKAVAGFALGPANLACLQARLNLYNPYASWLARQFTVEYSALFDAMLPALQRRKLPIPLGGTSNHFRTDVLRSVGAWDAYNVTEDADLGIRLARLGWHVGMLDSTTFEEAPTKFPVWLTQRTRWLKGWMQTYLVHMRRPGALYRDLGWARFSGLQILMGGILLSVLVHPIFYILLAISAWNGEIMSGATGGPTNGLLVIAMVNLIAGYLSAILTGAAAVMKRGRLRLALTALTMPVYWLLVSAAAYRALYQLARAPYLWEKTEHKGA